MSLLRGRRSPNRPTRGWIPRGFPLVVEGNRYNQVSMDTIEDAKRTVAFDSALDLIASLASEMDLVFWDSPSYETDRQRKPAPKWFDNLAGDGFDVNDWIYQALVSLVARGNLFGRELEAWRGIPTQVDIVHPDRVRPPAELQPGDTVLPDGANWLVDGNSDPLIRHWRVAPLPGTLLGPSLIATHATTLRLPQVAASFGAHWFDDGGHPSSLLTNEYLDAASLDSKQAQRLKERFIAATQGRREPLVLGRGWKCAQISVTAEESQFLKTLGYSQAEVARIFGPGVSEMLGYASAGGGGLTYSNLEGRAAHLLVFGIGKWLSRIERVLKTMCPSNTFPALDRSKIVNSTPAQLYKNLQVALGCRLMTPNEARAMAGLPRVEWGDEPNPIAGANVDQNSEMADDPNNPNDNGTGGSGASGGSGK